MVGPAPRLAVEWIGQGPLVLFLHGIGGNRKTWDAQLKEVGRHFLAAAWDARGYLDSEDYEGPLQFEYFSDDVRRVLDAFGVESAHIVGLSMGGRIALNFVERYPRCVASLVLADTSAGSEVQASPAKVEEFLRLRKRPLLEGKSLADIAPSVAKTLVGPHCPDEVLEKVIASLSALHLESYLKTLDTVTRFDRFPEFEKVSVPTLVLAGEHDPIATPHYAARMARRLPQGSFRQLAGVGHTSNLEDPVAFNAELLPFLQRHRALAPEAKPPS